MIIYVIGLVLSAAALDSCQAFVSRVGGNYAGCGGSLQHHQRHGFRASSALSALVAPAPPHHAITYIGNVESSDGFDRVVQDGAREKKVVAVWFQASWCRKCKYIGSRLRHLEEHLPPSLTDNVSVFSLDVNKVAQVPQEQKIKDLPTIKFFAGGQEICSYVAYDRGDVFYGKMEEHLRVAIEKL